MSRKSIAFCTSWSYYLTMVNLEHLQVIDTICREGSFQKASEKLHKVRSAVSYSVKQVENHYDMRIFNRDSYRPELTPEGKTLLVQIRRLLKHASEFEAFVDDMKGESETELSLGVSSMFPIDRVSDLLLDLKSEFPSTSIHLEIEIASGERMLLEENVDIGIYGALSPNAAIDYKLIETFSIPVVIANKMAIEDSAVVTEQELLNYPQIIVKSSDRRSPDTFIANDAQKWYVTDLASKKALITAGLGWGRLPQHMIEDELNNGELIKLQNQGEIKLPVYIAKLKSKTLGPVAQRIWDYF